MKNKMKNKMKSRIKYYIVMIFVFIALVILNNNISKASNDTEMMLDYPREATVKTEMYVEGWIMSQQETELKVLIGNYDVTDQLVREERQDVINAIKGYGDEIMNPTPGFSGTVDLTQIPDGTYVLSAQAISTKTGKILKKLDKQITVKKYNTNLHIDYPNIEEQKDTFYLEGWVMSEDPGTIIKVFIDGYEVEQQINRTKRRDVINAIKGYGTKSENPFPGIEATIDVSHLTDGPHTVVIRAQSSSTNEIYMECTKNIRVKKYDSQICWDYPKLNQTSNYDLYIEGWVMSEDKNATVQILVDNNDVTENIERTERQDVLNAVNGYGGKDKNVAPGFVGNVNLENYKDGVHIITLKVSSPKTGELIYEESRRFVLNKYSSDYRFDYPIQNGTVKDNLYIEGWIMSENKNATITLSIDGKDYSSYIQRVERQDVLNAVSGCGGKEANPLPGFYANIDISDVKDGLHKVALQITSPQTNEIIARQEKIIQVHKYESTMIFDYPKQGQNEKNNLYVEGWLMSENEDAKINLYIDGEDYSSYLQRVERQDVWNAIKDYGGKEKNPLPGFKANIDLTNIKDGKHTVTLHIISPLTNETIFKQERTIQVNKYESTMMLDYPKQGEMKKTDLYVEGWLMSEDENAKITLSIDGKDYSTYIERVEREDVWNDIEDYGGKETNPLPGYIANIDLTNIKDGTHTILVQAISPKTNEMLCEIRRTINIKKYDGTIYIETPISNMITTQELYIEGWTMTECPKSTVKILMDNRTIDVEVKRRERADVINAIKDYGGIEENPTPGFYTTVNTKQFTEGRHTLTIQVISNLGEVITEYNKVISIYLNKYWGIDVSEHQGEINYDALVSTQKLDFMIIRAGYGKFPEQIDDYFERNYREATARNIPVGAYLYSYATDVEGAKLEAYNMLSWLNGRSFELPIFYDIEDSTQDGIDMQTKTDMCIAFCDIIKSAGYKVGIYTNKNRLITQIDLDRIPNDYSIWVASYGQNNGDVPDDIYQYTGNHDIWQYTSTGTINGISGYVDFNICYKKYF